MEYAVELDPQNPWVVAFSAAIWFIGYYTQKIKADYLDELWISNPSPFLQETILDIHRFSLICKGIEPN